MGEESGIQPTSLWRDCDRGVEAAIAAERDPSRPPQSFDEFLDEFAAFTFFGGTKSAPLGEGLQPGFRRLNGPDNVIPKLWKNVYAPIARILRNDETIGPFYAGFATFFAVDFDQDTGLHKYPSMALDVDLGTKGFRNLELTRRQFDDRKRKGDDSSRKPGPLVLTDIVLHPTYRAKGRNLESCPVMFHWRQESSATLDLQSWAKAPRNLEDWTHVFVSADIPTDEDYGLRREIEWGKAGFSELVVQSGASCLVSENDIYTMLGVAAGMPEAECGPEYATNRNILRNGLAWTLCYFAYGCGTYLGEKLKELTIVCIPASFAGDVTSALYVPLSCKCTNPELPKVVDRLVYLARALSAPLWRFKELTEARRLAAKSAIDAVNNDFAHQVKKMGSNLGSWLLEPEAWQDLMKKHPEIVAGFKPRQLSGDSTPWQIAPFPRLFTALGQQLVIWSRSWQPDDLFPNMGGDGAGIPENLEELVQHAWAVAKDANFLNYHYAKTFSSQDDAVIDAMQFDGVGELHLETRHVAGVKIDHKTLKNALGGFGPTDGFNNLHWSQLSGLLRLFVVACENYLENGAGALEVRCTNHGTWLSIKLCNKKKNSSVSRRPLRAYAGSTGTQVMEDICKTYISNLNASILTTEPSGLSDFFVLELKMTKPRWLNWRDAK